MISQKQEILNYLRTHKKGISGKEAMDKLGIYRLSDVVHKLRKDGYNITTENEKTMTKKGRGYSYYGRYKLGI